MLQYLDFFFRAPYLASMAINITFLKAKHSLVYELAYLTWEQFHDIKYPQMLFLEQTSVWFDQKKGPDHTDGPGIFLTACEHSTP